MEIWKGIPEWENLYQVSNQGRVRSFDKQCPARFGKPILRKGRILKPTAKGGRYLAVTLADGPKRKQYLIHDLVLLTFIGPKPKGMYVCHGDDNRINNRLENLRYGTPKENVQDALRNGVKPIGEKHGVAKLKNDQVKDIRSSELDAKTLAKKYGVCVSHICNIKARKTWVHI
ncbi:NUMOD4 motif-containing HNH endonuclease [Acinetobacter baumannii]|uniref:NUMOD4 motif-containing HNH endonuclease n=1 Tax=Acinetobacter baumannii TaxID=470 RepID=UPI003FA398F2